VERGDKKLQLSNFSLAICRKLRHYLVIKAAQQATLVEAELNKAIGYSKLGPKTLAARLEAAVKAMGKASDAIYAEALCGTERFLEITDRLGADNKKVVKFRDKSSIVGEIEAECVLRYGQAVTHASQWPTFLRVRA